MANILTIYNMDDILTFVDRNSKEWIGDKFRTAIANAADRMPEFTGGAVFRLTNDPAIRQGYTSNMEEAKNVAHFPFPEATYVFTVIELEGPLAIANEVNVGTTRCLIVVNLDDGRVEDLTHML